MGIKCLYSFLTKHASGAIVKKPLSCYKNKTFAIDATLYIYQWCSVGISRNIKNKRGQYINHVQGALYKTMKLLENNITPIYVFDGKPPPTKADTLAARRGVPGRVRVPAEVYDECKKLFRLMGVQYVDAPAEAEAQAAAMTRQTDIAAAYGVLTDDTDALPFGAKRLLRWTDTHIVEIDLDLVLDNLKLTMIQFVDLCILMGSDHTKTLRGIGPEIAYKLMLKHGSIKKIIAAMDLKDVNKFFDYESAQKVFLEHPVKLVQFGPSTAQIIAAIDRDKLKNYLLSHDLGDKKIEKVLARLAALKE